MDERARRRSATTTPTDPAERAREIALRLLAHSPRSAAQLREGLLSRDVPAGLADSLVVRYREVGLLDDAALAGQIVRSRHQERGQARRAIAQELSRRGFAEQDASAALAQVSDQDEQEAAVALLAARWPRLAGLEPRARARRAAGLLGRRGYPPQTAYAALRALETGEIWETVETEGTEEG